MTKLDKIFEWLLERIDEDFSRTLWLWRSDL